MSREHDGQDGGKHPTFKHSPYSSSPGLPRNIRIG
jgi:hypothetical protein